MNAGRKFVSSALVVAAGVLSSCQRRLEGPKTAAPHIAVGAPAPDFSLPGTDGKTVQLSQLLKGGPVILAFFPKAFTSGWTAELKAYRDRYAELEKKGGQVVGISTDDLDTLKRFKAELELPFPLLSDTKGEVVAQYGGKNMFDRANRSTFVIDTDGKVKDITEGLAAISPGGAIDACPIQKK